MGDNTYKKLRIICLLLAIICMVLSLVKRANAENMDPILVDKFYQENIYLASNISQVSVLSNLAQDGFCNFSYFDYTQSGNNYRIYYICKGNVFLPGSVNTSNNSFDPITGWYGDRESYFVGGIDRSTWENIGQGNTALYCVKMQIASSSYSIVSCFGMSYSSGYDGTIANKTSNVYYNGNNIGQLSYNGPRTSNSYSYGSVTNPSSISCSNIYTNQVTYCRSYRNSSDLIKIDNVIDLAALYPDRNTDGFNIYKYGISGNERLVCDFSRTDITSFSPATAEASTIDLVIDINGTEYNYSFDSNDSFYQYSKNDRIALYSFPFYELGIDENTISAKLISCEVNNTVSSPGGSTTKKAVWVTPLLLVGSDYEDLEPEVIPKETLPDYDKFDDPSTQMDYTLTTNRWLTGTYSYLPLDLFNRWNFEVKYKVIPIVENSTAQNIIDGFVAGLRSALNLNLADVLDTLVTLGQGQDVYDIINEYLENNYYSEYYDLLAFCYQDAAGSDPVYYIFTSDSYNSHLTNSYLYDIMQTIFDNGKALDATYNYLYDKLNDFEDKTLTKLNENVGLLQITNDWLNNINVNLGLIKDILNNILNALRDLNIPEPDYTIITDKLDDIIAVLNNQSSGNINSDSYENYREWLWDINNNDNYMSPHEYAIEVFNDIKGIFSWTTGSGDPDTGSGLISFARYFIDFVNGSNPNVNNKYNGNVVNGFYDPHNIGG